MATEQAEQVQEEVVGQEIAEHEPVEQAEAPSQDDASFEEGFDAARGVEPEPEPEPVLYAGFTAEQLKERLAEVDKIKERDQKIFGTLGGLRQTIDALKSQPAPQGARLNLEGAFSRIAKDYPEMAEALAEDMREAFSGASVGGQGPDIEKIVSERLEGASKQFEVKLLSMRHKDWRSEVQTPEFAQWKGTLAPDELQVVNESWDASSVSESLDKFKSWKSQATQQKESRMSRLEAAITPKGTRQPAANSAQDAFMQGFNAVRGRKP